MTAEECRRVQATERQNAELREVLERERQRATALQGRVAMLEASLRASYRLTVDWAARAPKGTV